MKAYESQREALYMTCCHDVATPSCWFGFHRSPAITAAQQHSSPTMPPAAFDGRHPGASSPRAARRCSHEHALTSIGRRRYSPDAARVFKPLMREAGRASQVDAADDDGRAPRWPDRGFLRSHAHQYHIHGFCSRRVNSTMVPQADEAAASP